ncbi:MAG: SMC family ATPase [Polyangia bacterium]
MRPAVLEMQAFGPFATKERVDFTQLGERSFFLIHGPTGAGKTTLLDAICYALYGDTSGGERDASAMRSDHADAGTETYVQLEFSLGQDRYRIRRSPQQERPKKRGTGLVTVAAEAQLDAWRDGTWTSLETQPAKATARTETLLGFSKEQFRQVVVLPQGRFREVLTADSKVRETILESLFSTELYRRVQEAMKAQAGTVGLDVRDLLVKRSAVLQLAGVQDPLELDGREAELVSAHTAALELATNAAQHEEAARAALRCAEDVTERLAEQAEARRVHAGLAADLAATDARRTVLAAGRRARDVVPVELALRTAAVAVEAATLRAASAARAAITAQAHAEAVQITLFVEEARAPVLREVEERLSMLAKVEASQRVVAGLSDKLRALGARRPAGQREQLVQALADGEAALAAARLEREAAREAAAPLEALRLQLTQARAQARRMVELGTLRDELKKATAALGALEATARATATSAGEATDSLRTTELAHRAGHAARLASGLHDGAACPVCGSATHPAPAHAEVELVQDATIDAAHERARTAASTAARALLSVQTKEVQIAALRTRCDERAAELGEAPSTDASALEQLLTTAEASGARAAQLATRILQLEQQQLDARGTLEALDAALAVEQHERARLEAEIELRVLEAPAHLRDPAALRAALSTTKLERDGLVGALETARATHAQADRDRSAAQALHVSEAEGHARLETERAQRHTEYLAALRTAAFHDEASYAAARRDPHALDELERLVTEHDTRLAAATERLARATTAAHGLVPSDIEAAKTSVQVAKDASHRAVEARGRAASQLDELRRLAAGLASMVTQLAETEARYAVLGRLSDVANGDNPRKLSFQRFVLANLLDEVLEAASLRLGRMSRGRYELRRVTERGDQRMAGGLDIDVLDHHTGVRRPGNTLSGGEGFLASLSLALGLADIVQARAGGIRLETLFVDEGFGSLDPESLELAMRTLLDLRQTGRMVGIISHVAELTERIDVRLEVHASGTGSRIQLHLP